MLFLALNRGEKFLVLPFGAVSRPSRLCGALLIHSSLWGQGAGSRVEAENSFSLSEFSLSFLSIFLEAF